MLFSRELISLLALASAVVVSAAPTPAPGSEEVAPTPELGEIFGYVGYKRDTADVKRSEEVAPTPALGEVFEYGIYKRDTADVKRSEEVAPIAETGQTFSYGNDYDTRDV